MCIRDRKYFEELIDEMKAKKGVTQDVELDADDLKELASDVYKRQARYRIKTLVSEQGKCSYGFFYTDFKTFF